MPKSNKEKKPENNLKCTARISVQPYCFNNPRPSSPPYQALSPQPITKREFLLTPKSTSPLLTSPPSAPTQPSKHSSPLSINLDPVELIFSTHPTSPHALFDSLEDLPPRTTNPPLLRPSFESIKHLENQPPPLPAMEPPLLPFPPQLSSLPLSTVNTASIKDNDVDKNIVYGCANDPNMLNLEEIVYLDDDEDVGAEADMTNSDTNIPRAIGTKWIYRNKKDERGIVVRNKVRLVAQGYTQEEGIDYDEVFSPVARIEAIRLSLAYASFKDFVVYQMDVKSAFMYGKIEEEVYVCQPPGFKDPEFPDRVYKVEKALYCLHQAPRAWYETLSTYL
nr:retrovirus-related Pol polyprotein from transposon TNT 1-94 [Tanacetum cinerariifolium]